MVLHLAGVEEHVSLTPAALDKLVTVDEMFVEMLVAGEGDAEVVAGADGAGHLVVGARVRLKLFFVQCLMADVAHFVGAVELHQLDVVGLEVRQDIAAEKYNYVTVLIFLVSRYKGRT